VRVGFALDSAEEASDGQSILHRCNRTHVNLDASFKLIYFQQYFTYK
jgi:hypothetical protein